MRARALVAVTVSATLFPFAVAGPAAGADGDAYRAAVRGRAGHELSSMRAGAGKPVDLRRAQSTTTKTRTNLGPSGPTTLSTDALPQPGTPCDITVLGVNPLADRTVLHVNWQGAASVVVQRRRNQGALRTLTTISGPTGTVNDRGVNPRAAYWYTIVAKSSSGSVIGTCDSTWVGSIGRPLGNPDVVVAGDGIFQQNAGAQGYRVRSGVYVTPAFSADGRLYAATRFDDLAGTAVLEVRRAVNSALLFTVDLGAAELPADPAFSPDGQQLAYTRYATDTGEPLGLGFIDVHGSHVRRSATYDVPVAEPSWRPDSSSLVVSSWDAAQGLSVVCPTCTTVAPIAGTAGGYAPEVSLDGTLYFAVTTDTVSTLKKRTSGGTVTTLRSSATDIYTLPKVIADGSLYFEQDIPNDPANPSYWTATVKIIEPDDPTWDQSTQVGLEYDGGRDFSGYDVRLTQEKGTSDFVAEGHHDLVARDTYGGLWAYRNTGFDLGGRTQIGTGWKGFTAILPMDLTSDDRADLVARDAYGVLWLYKGLPNRKFASRVRIGTGWGSYHIVAAGDWNGDDLADLVARDGGGTLWLYPGTGRGTFTSRKQIGSGWGGMTALVGAGDVNLDNAADLVARDKSGYLWLYPGTGSGGFQPRRLLGTGWGSFTALTVLGVTDQVSQIYVRTTSGQLVRWYTYGDGAVASNSRTALGYGWSGMLVTS